ncbi:MAG: outer membrane lipoprotein-sorting protein [Persicimonas sp.]
MKIKTYITLSVAAMLTLVAATAHAEKSADEIIEKALESNALGFQAGEAKVSLDIEDRAGESRERKMGVKSKDSDDGSRTLVELTAPKDLKDQAFLFSENDDGSDDVWMYVPAFEVTRRIEGSQKNGAFLGSHFTYADLESRDIEEGSYTRLDDDKVGEHPVYVVRTTPEDDDSEYGKVLTYIRKSDFFPLRIEFFDEEGGKEKTLFIEEIEETDDGKKYTKKMTLRPESGGYTTIEINSLDAKSDLPDSLFSKEQLGK